MLGNFWKHLGYFLLHYLVALAPSVMSKIVFTKLVSGGHPGLTTG